MTAASKCNVVVVVLDTVRWFSTGLYDSTVRTPWLDRYAESSVVYEQARTSAPWTLPSHASLFTGLFPSEHNVSNLRPFLPEGVPTLAAGMLRGGYQTVAVSANAWLGADFGMSRGFERFVRGWQLVETSADLAGRARLAGDGTLARIRGTLSGGSVRQMPRIAANIGYSAMRSRGRFDGRRIARLALKEADAAQSDPRPTFMLLNFLDAHLPYNPPLKHRRQAGLNLRRTFRLDQDPFKYIVGVSNLREPDMETLRKLYEAEISALDDILAWLIPKLMQRLGSNTLVVITSDHGENIGDHGLLDHQFSLHDTLLRIPLIVRLPGDEGAGERRDDLVLLQDLYETILDLTATAHTPTPSSRKLPGALGGQPRGAVIAQYPAVQPEVARLVARYRGAVTEGLDRTLTSVVDSHRRKGIWRSDGSSVSYATNSDPWESTELHDEACLGELAALRDRELAGLRPLAPTNVDPSAEADEEIRRQLEAIGYL